MDIPTSNITRMTIGNIISFHDSVRDLVKIQSESAFRLNLKDINHINAVKVLLKTNPVITVKHKQKYYCIANRRTLMFAGMVLGVGTTIDIKVIGFDNARIRLFSIVDSILCPILFSSFNEESERKGNLNSDYFLPRSRPLMDPSKQINDSLNSYLYRYSDMVGNNPRVRNLFSKDCLISMWDMQSLYCVRNNDGYEPVINKHIVNWFDESDVISNNNIWLISRVTNKAMNRALKIEYMLCAHIYALKQLNKSMVANMINQVSPDDISMLFKKNISKKDISNVFMFSRQSFYRKNKFHADVKINEDKVNLADFDVKLEDVKHD